MKIITFYLDFYFFGVLHNSTKKFKKKNKLYNVGQQGGGGNRAQLGEPINIHIMLADSSHFKAYEYFRTAQAVPIQNFVLSL